MERAIDQRIMMSASLFKTIFLQKAAKHFIGINTEAFCQGEAEFQHLSLKQDNKKAKKASTKLSRKQTGNVAHIGTSDIHIKLPLLI